MTTLIGGPFDGAAARFGDPGVVSVWVAMKDGQLVYRPCWVPGRPRYDRESATRYVHEGLDSGVARLDLVASL